MTTCTAPEAPPAPRPAPPLGGRFVPEPLVPALDRLEHEWRAAREDRAFRAELAALLARYAGRPTPLQPADRFSELAGHPVLLKREDLLHTGGHKITNTLGQALFARRLGFRRLIAETGSGQHGIATATAAAKLGLACTIHVARAPSRVAVDQMRLLGADVRPVAGPDDGVRSAFAQAMRDWMADTEGSYFLPGSCVGPAPLPSIVGDLQSVIGDETREQLRTDGRRPARIVACVGGGANAWGIFSAFLDDDVELVGVEAGDVWTAPLTTGARGGILHGARIPLIRDRDGHAVPRRSIAEGLRYPGAGPQHGRLRDSGRAHYVAIDDHRALAAYRAFARCEGILPAIEAAHALAWVADHPSALTVICLSGRGEKDLALIAAAS
ncbi:Tryptophan synthase beta chain [Patulibacter medicamentivorans]|uniref:Tryptophan synthase beta chain n=1 Tax=Patulibacter medicamentivorans TaxID=1097667 RepID=H0EAI3_9ACTN|nr:pyridoxal-phosphate dependent enzyme [Patulibacter medicamentivorans]EHN09310.1 Tryptophan synthase beta chain [Patulibacter medicamentivorans]